MGEIPPKLENPQATTDDLRQLIIESGYAEAAKDMQKLIGLLDERFPVIGHFIVDRPPDDGPAALDIKRQWVGLALPVRVSNPKKAEGTHSVLATEALNALWENNRREAFWWWRDYYYREAVEAGRPLSDVIPLLNSTFLYFSDRYGHFDDHSQPLV